MKIIVEKHDIRIIEEEIINENELNIQKCIFEFSDDYDKYSNLVKEAIFIKNDKAYKNIIFNNQCDIPLEILKVFGSVSLGVCAYEVFDDKNIIRFSPKPIKFYVDKGSYIENAENSEVITGTEFEQYMQALNNRLNEIPDIVKEELKNFDLESIDFSNYVRKEEGKGLSTNDFTTEDKKKLDSITNYDDTFIKEDIKQLNEKVSNILELPDGEDGATYTPNIDLEGNLSWTNNKGLENPSTVNIMGPRGSKGEKGDPGQDGKTGLQGESGYTPVKGVDYYTEEDKMEIKNYCKSYIDENYLNKLEGAY